MIVPKWQPMSLNEAVTVIRCWLLHKDIVCLPGSARAIDAQHFQVSMQQVFPEQKALNFQVIPEKVADCWRVVEVNVV